MCAFVTLNKKITYLLTYLLLHYLIYTAQSDNNVEKCTRQFSRPLFTRVVDDQKGPVGQTPLAATSMPYEILINPMRM